MQDVIEIGTGRPARIPGINICGKTGTAENKRVVDGRVVKLNNHSIFVCFAPRENPKIAVAVIVENGGHGAAQAAPIASLLVEKYLNDTIRTERLALEDEITGRNLMPKYLVRFQFKADSSRAADWARQSGDSSRWIKYQTPSYRAMMQDTSGDSKSPLYLNLKRSLPYKSALAERLAKRKAAADAATAAAAASAASNAAQQETGFGPQGQPPLECCDRTRAGKYRLPARRPRRRPLPGPPWFQKRIRASAPTPFTKTLPGNI